MGLSEYRKKRKLSRTPEPEGGMSAGGKLYFVVQKHEASRLHYDFRLELDGVMKSWAIPKGPSLRPEDKRLAIQVEDHPIDYKDFEGVIPEGNYGAGTVIIWDHGTYEPVGQSGSRKEAEKQLLAALKKGSVKIRLYGKKLNGEFALVHTKGRGENAWLLIKHRDEFATNADVLKKTKSVVSGKTIEGMTRSAKGKKQQRDSTPKKKSLLTGIRKKKKSAIPVDVEPMLATLVDEPFHEKGWLYEVKWDGYRAISYVRDGHAEIRSRNNKSFNRKFYPVHRALEEWKHDVVVDGEIIVVNNKGEPDFGALQDWRSEADGQLIYYVFDILWMDGYDLGNVTLKQRKSILSEIVPESGLIRFSENFERTGHALFEQADKLSLEGIMAKKENSVYVPGTRSKDWLKIKTQKHQEVVIGGYTRNANSKKAFSALLVGGYQNGSFVFIGPVGTGFTTKSQREILSALKPHETAECPFETEPDYNQPSRFRPNPPKATVTWVRPRVVAEVAYRTRSKDGSLRHPSFRGLRGDKAAKEIRMEVPAAVSEVVEDPSQNSGIIRPHPKEGRKSLLNPADETQVRKIGGHDIKFTNLSKVFWPDEAYTKRDMLNYYYQIAPYMLPYMKDRPQTLNRFPNGIDGKSFYQKDVTGKVPSWIQTHPYFSEGDQRQKHFLVCSDEASLLYIASLGCIEMNPWSSRSATPDQPDWCVIDLDPDKRTPFHQVIEAANVIRQILETLGVESCCKTSGSTGLHIYIPLGAKYSYEESKELARALVKIVHNELPSSTTIERKVSDRGGKMYLDFLQNRPQATIAGPYSLRPKPGAPVSMPLDWEEVKKGLSNRDYTITNAVSRVRSEGDLFGRVLGKGIDLSKTMVSMLRIFGRV